MRRTLVAVALSVALGVLTACSGGHEPTYRDGTTLTVTTPRLSALKERSDVELPEGRRRLLKRRDALGHAHVSRWRTDPSTWRACADR